MADDWIKMRASLITHPKVTAIARLLYEDVGFRNWIGLDPEGVRTRVTERYSALRYVTVTGLLVLWSCARRHGVFDGSDLILQHSTLEDIDHMAGVPGFGPALLAVGWITEQHGITFYNFKSYNIPRSDADRQKAYRERQQRVTDPLQPVTARNANVTARCAPETETETDKKKTPKPPKGAVDGFDTFWAAWPSHPRKTSKGKCLEKWRKDGLAKQAAKVVEVVEKLKDTKGWLKNDGEFIPAPLVWLNNDGWDCDPDDLDAEPWGGLDENGMSIGWRGPRDDEPAFPQEPRP